MDGIKIKREWAMPDSRTFDIVPIRNLVKRYVGDGSGWIDPFCGGTDFAELTNDLNPDKPAKFHLHAKDFIIQLNGQKFNGVLFDPPYSLTQVKECYNNIGIDLMDKEDVQNFPTHIKDLIAPKIKAGGIALCFGWDTTGFGKQRGFELIEILMVCHGGRHNDTLCTVERKFQYDLF